MKKHFTFKSLLIFVSLSLISFYSTAQLSGSYTIGGINPDYTTIGSAINALYSNGVSGNVVFDIRSGNYSGFTVDSIPGLAYPDSIIFQSELHDSSSVIISGNSKTVKLVGCYGVTLKWLTIEATSVTSGIAADFLGTYGCSLKNCIINTPNSCAVFIERNHVHTQLNTVANCFFTGSGGGITLEYADCKTKVLNNKIQGTGGCALCSTYSTILMVDNNILNSGIDFSFTTGTAFTNNQVTGGADLDHFNQVIGNSFGSGFQSVSFTYRNNNFGSGFSISSISSPIVDKNTFGSDVHIINCPGTKFYNNNALAKVFFSSTDNATLAGNSIKGLLALGGLNFKIYCNLFYNYVQVNSQNAKFYYNNFSDSAYIWSQIYDIEARYNNFSQHAYAPGTITYNNYFPTGGEYDGHPFRYDPMYISQSNVRAQNPLLTGKGIPISYITKDIDSVIRGTNPTIGANEICISSPINIDSLNLTCGDKIKLKLCSFDGLQGYKWYPTIGLDDSLSLSPFAKPTQSTTYYLIDSTGIAKDSIHIAVNDFVHQNIPDDSITCYQKVLLSGNFNPGATYGWTPATGLSDSTIYNPWAHPPANITYVQQTNISGCGVFYDTVIVYVDPMPVADGQVYYSGANALFYNYSLCGDWFFWDFGDGQTSTLPGDTGITHHYDSAGTYIVSLIVCNVYGCDTFYFNAISVGINELSGLDDSLEIFPNPASTKIIIKGVQPNVPIIVNNLLGQTIGKYVSENGSTTIDVTNLPKGMYFINNRKFLKE